MSVPAPRRLELRARVEVHDATEGGPYYSLVWVNGGDSLRQFEHGTEFVGTLVELLDSEDQSVSELPKDHMPSWTGGGNWDGWQFLNGYATRRFKVGESTWSVHIRGSSLWIGSAHQYCESAAQAKRIADAAADDKGGWA